MSRPEGFHHTDITKERISIAHTGKKLSQEHCERISKGFKELHKRRTTERRSLALREYYQEHKVWNKGLPWPKEIREKIREGCLNSSMGMGPKAEAVGQE